MPADGGGNHVRESPAARDARGRPRWFHAWWMARVRAPGRAGAGRDALPDQRRADRPAHGAREARRDRAGGRRRAPCASKLVVRSADRAALRRRSSRPMRRVGASARRSRADHPALPVSATDGVLSNDSSPDAARTSRARRIEPRTRRRRRAARVEARDEARVRPCPTAPPRRARPRAVAGRRAAGARVAAVRHRRGRISLRWAWIVSMTASMSVRTVWLVTRRMRKP